LLEQPKSDYSSAKRSATSSRVLRASQNRAR